MHHWGSGSPRRSTMGLITAARSAPCSRPSASSRQGSRCGTSRRGMACVHENRPERPKPPPTAAAGSAPRQRCAETRADPPAATASSIVPRGIGNSRAREIVVFSFQAREEGRRASRHGGALTGVGPQVKDIALLGQMMKQGADLNLPQTLLCLTSTSALRCWAEAGAIDARAAAYSCEVREPRPAYPDSGHSSVNGTTLYSTRGARGSR